MTFSDDDVQSEAKGRYRRFGESHEVDVSVCSRGYAVMKHCINMELTEERDEWNSRAKRLHSTSVNRVSLVRRTGVAAVDRLLAGV